MEWILGILILILGGAAIVVIYLSERINIFETLLGLNPKVTSDNLAEHVTFGPNPFGNLSGENLWKAMAGEEIEDDNIDIGDVESMRPRYELVITRHIEMILEDGRFDARAKERTPVKPILRIPMLRGSVESFIPFTEASRFYEIGQEVETKPESAEELGAEVDEIVDELFSRVQIERTTSFGRALLPMADSSNNETDDLEESDTSGDDGQLALPPVEENATKSEES
ncbi:MAG TPA: hypothetical protein DIC49_00210 [Gammaproteobacteria bacterium]|nr:hypothetical protein [Gammaproteobacteria bacterium]|tara:strand:- start:257 stop:937 length:681 start_codon:yes stop_codon:yes gene_type:complete